MENLPAILDSLASLAWPIIVVIVLFSFRNGIKELMETAKSRKFTVKVAGNELTMEELSEQQRTIVADVQRQLVDLQKQIEPLLKAQQMHPATEPLLMAEEKRPETVKWILWADDNPKNNAFLIEGLQDQGIDVVTALSTNEALAKFSGKKFDRVITDLGRQEDGRFNPMAGIELIRRIRSMDAHVPIFVYTNVRSASEQRRTALEAGANDITASPTDLLSMLQLSKS